MSRIYIPASSAEQWALLLADPELHWKKGHSARTLAYSWQEAKSFPDEIRKTLSSVFPTVELLLAFPEHKVSLTDSARPSQPDIWVLARNNQQLISIAVEGKVSESFGPTVQEWQAQASSGKSQRLSYLLDQLGLKSVPGSLRYQLLHRTVSAIIEAQRFNAAHAVMLVHSFSESNAQFSDFAAFVSLMGGATVQDSMIPVGTHSGVNLYLAWVHGNPLYLSR